MKEKLSGGFLVFLGACSFGVLSTIVKTAYSQGYTLGQVTGIQCLSGTIILWLLFLLQRLISPKSNQPLKVNQPKIRKTWHVCAIGIFPGLVGILYYQCVKLLPASIAIILLMQYLWISILLDYLLFKHRPTRIQFISIIIVMLGSCLAANLFSQQMTLNLTGVLFGLAAATAYSLFLITSANIGNQLPKLKKSALMITGACLTTFVIFPPLFLLDYPLLLELLPWGLWLGLLGVVLPPFLFSIGVPKVGISLGAILSAAELPVAVLSSYLVLKEVITWSQWSGVIIILMAIIFVNFRLKKRNKLKPMEYSKTA